MSGFVKEKYPCMKRFFYAPKTMFDREKTDINYFGGNIFMSTFLFIKLLITRYKNTSPEYFEFSRFDLLFCDKLPQNAPAGI